MKIHYITGSRADFGLMESCLDAIHQSPHHELGIIATGQHLSEAYGRTIDDIYGHPFPVVKEIPVALTGLNGLEMGKALSIELAGILDYWRKDRPDLVLLLGDRGEMLAGALAAVHLGIHIAHIHGGERTGTLDESFRHAITKLSHIHFPATQDAADRLKRMGENPEFIHIIGAPGLVGIKQLALASQQRVVTTFGLTNKAFALGIFHPVVQESNLAREQIHEIVSALRKTSLFTLILRPNSDAGGKEIDEYMDNLVNDPQFLILSHLTRIEYLATLSLSKLIIGNSSSGIIESASLGTPCVNIGSRQNSRLRNNNTIDCPTIARDQILNAIHSAFQLPLPYINKYGDGKTDIKLLDMLTNLDVSITPLSKQNTY